MGRPTEQDALVAVDGTPEAFAVVWLRQTSGIRNEVVVASGREEGGAIAFNAEQVLPTSADAAPYAPVIRALGGGNYFVVWTQVVMSPDFEVHGRIVAL